MNGTISYDRTNPPLMKCGHVANGEKVFLIVGGEEMWVPSCVICSCIEIAQLKPPLTGRVSLCTYANPKTGVCPRNRRYSSTYPSRTESNWALPFFEYRPDAPHDLHYCGCWGWD